MKCEKITGIVERVTFQNEENGWTVLKVSPLFTGKILSPITVTLHQAHLFPGATLEFTGEWSNHQKFGRQFKADSFIEQKPASQNALEKYLGSGLIYGIGPKTAKKIVNFFGVRTLEIFEDNIDELIKVEGIAQKKLASIQKSWTEHREVRNIMLFLQGQGVSTLFALKIYKKYYSDSIEVVKSNPYRLATDIYGIGFQSADQIALNLGIGEKADLRVQAGIMFSLDKAREDGHVYLSKKQVIQNLNLLLGISFNQDELIQHFKFLIEEEKIFYSNEFEVESYYSRSLYFDEKLTADYVIKKNNIEITVNNLIINDWLSDYNSKQEFPLSDQQLNSIKGIVWKPISILTGGPGCGKTTTIKTLHQLLLYMQKKVLFAAPTGRAAQRMGEVLGYEAKTIHRLLEWSPQSASFVKNEKNPIDCEVIIIDECSMLDISLTNKLLNAIAPETQILLIGDPDQLPSVGPGNVLNDFIESGAIPTFRLTQVFRQKEGGLIIDAAYKINRGEKPNLISPFKYPSSWKEKKDVLFIDSEIATQEQLRVIQKVKKFIQEDRQDDDENFESKDYLELPQKFKHINFNNFQPSNNDIDDLKAILKKVHPQSSLHWNISALDMIINLYCKTIHKYYPKSEIQILSPMTKGQVGTHSLNNLIQESFNPEGPNKKSINFGGKVFRVGDRVIQKRNNYDLNVFNGDIGKVASIENEAMFIEFGVGEKSNIVEYKKENFIELELAYSITIHKSQGSEFDVIIIPIFNQHFKMLYRNLIYTGLTRAKKLVVLVGSRRALSMAIGQVNTSLRQTNLKNLLETRV
ncbi:AAA family ATPase [Bacteriovoracaceae bacterium]|nr:AAA family ATPase [Bacteriovoracaceae bacterium]